MKRLEIDFEGRTVLITGAATGIVRAIALAFAAARRCCTELSKGAPRRR
jgi:NAD(P)-dependent dehydrogenase (short-subunit alcohol dehydrogenase family)